MKGTFIYTRDAEVPAGLAGRILVRIAQAARRRAFLRAWGLGVVSIASLMALVESFQYAADEAYLSGFTEYTRLALTGGSAVLTAWRELGLSIIESLPAVGIALVCIVFCIFLWSASRTAKNVRTALALPKTA